MDYKIIAFDLDETLAPSKCQVDKEMVDLLSRLLKKKFVAIISGAKFEQFQIQLLDKLVEETTDLENLLILPTNGSVFYTFEGHHPQEKYNEVLTEEEKEKIIHALLVAVKESGVKTPENPEGKVIEDRGSQISWSANGQKASLDVKSVWDPDQEKRQKIRLCLEKMLPEFEARIGGSNTIDITRKGIDKAYALQKIIEHLNCSKEDILFIGDALFPGGNDWAAHQFGVDTIKIESVADTKEEIQKILEE